jgi:hypothetical protein
LRALASIPPVGAILPLRNLLDARSRLLVLCAISILAAAAPATAGGAERSIRNTLGGSVNLPGVQNALDVSWRWRLRGKDAPMLFREAHLAAGVSHALTPNHTRLGVFGQFAPLSIFELRAGFEPVAYLGIVGAALSYDAPDVDYSKRARDAIRARAEYAAGYRAYVSPAVQFKLGPLAGRSVAELEWWRVAVRGDFFYEPARDVLLRARGDRVLTVFSVLLHERELSNGRRLSFGALHRLSDVRDAPQRRSERLGVLGIYALGERRFGLRQPTLYLAAYDYVKDPFKKRQLGATAAIAFELGR